MLGGVGEGGSGREVTFGLPEVTFTEVGPLGAIALVIAAFVMKTVSDLLVSRGHMRRLAEMVEVIDRLSALDLSDQERAWVERYRRQTVSSLPVRMFEPKFGPPDYILFAWLLGSAVIVLLGGTWAMLIVFSAAALALGVTASVSYSAGRRAESGKGKDLGAGDGL